MATITVRKHKSGTRYTAQTCIKHHGKIIHTESRTFEKKSHASTWAKKREVELEQPVTVGKANAKPITIGEMLKLYMDMFNIKSLEQELGPSKISHIKQLKT